jgi:glycosyltransferase involved in cell wall biosynthesis
VRGPPVSIGLPVYNGANFLARAVQSILDQDYTDFELVISDNGSNDATQELARAFAAADERVSYERHDVNRGMVWNYNHVVASTSAPLFKWAAHDDELLPTWLSRCVTALDAAPGAVLAYTRRLKVDSQGHVLKVARARPKRFLTTDAGPGERFADVLARTTSCIELGGLIRRSSLERTRLLTPFAAGDRILMAELLLLGYFVEVPEELFLQREHPDRSVRRHATAADMTAWLDPCRSGRLAMPTWRLGLEYARVIGRARLPGSERVRAYQGLAGWTIRRRFLLADNLLDATRATARRRVTPRLRTIRSRTPHPVRRRPSRRAGGARRRRARSGDAGRGGARSGPCRRACRRVRAPAPVPARPARRPRRAAPSRPVRPACG